MKSLEVPILVELSAWHWNESAKVLHVRDARTTARLGKPPRSARRGLRYRPEILTVGETVAVAVDRHRPLY